MPSTDLDIHLRMRYIRQARSRLPRLPGNLRQLGATGPVIMPTTGQHPQVMVKMQVTHGRTTAQHLAYLTHGKGPERQDAVLFGPGMAQQQFAQAAHQDSRQFRLVVSPSVPEIGDRTRFITFFMAQVEHDLHRPLIWVAAHHYDTAHPHTHIAIRGRDACGEEFFMAKHYFRDGLRERATQLLALLRGPQQAQTMSHDSQDLLAERQQESSLAHVTRTATLSQTRDGVSRSTSDPDQLLAQVERLKVSRPRQQDRGLDLGT